MPGISLISSQSRRDLLTLIKRRESISLDQAEEATDLARTTIREHLGQLERDGYVERHTVKQGRGRPSLRFELTRDGEALFPTQAHEMLEKLIAFVQESGHEELLEQFFSRYWEERLREARFRMNSLAEGDLEARLATLRDILDDQGFMPELELSDEEITVRECNCPFPEAVKNTRLPCELEARFYEQLLDAKLKRVSYIPEGNPACTYVVKRKTTEKSK